MKATDMDEQVALLAFGRRVSPGETFDELVSAHGWQKEAWKPTFVESGECADETTARLLGASEGGESWAERQVLRREGCPEPRPLAQGGADAKLMVAASSDLPSLYFVEWHYIDFVMSCVSNVSEAARILGVRRSTLQRKRKKYPPSR